MTDLLPPPADAAAPLEPDAPPTPTPDPVPGPARSGRSAVVAAVVVALVLVLLVVFLLPMSSAQRQHQRSDRYVDPAPTYRDGQPAFLLQIPAIGLDQVVVSGSTPADLRGGPGWRTGTASPGQGNTVVLGHSTLWGAPFGSIAEVPAGSVISVRTTDGRVYRYRVDKVSTVKDGNDKPLDQGGPERLTLVTSAKGPFDTSRTVLVAGIAGRPPEVPEDYQVEVDEGAPSPYDDRPAGAAVLLVGGLLVLGMGIWGALAFRGRRSFLAIALVAGPTIALGVVLVLFNVDALIPTTF